VTEPQATQPSVLAFRVWGYSPRHKTLHSVTISTGQKPSWISSQMAAPDGAWPVGAFTAACKAGAEHEDGVPDPNCRCGIYATTDLDIIAGYLSESAPVMGLVAMGGRVIDGTKGYRAAAVKVAAILLLDPILTLDHHTLRAVAARYKVPAIVPHSTNPADYRERPESIAEDQAFTVTQAEIDKLLDELGE
jgi:hypothetical protein